MRLFFRDWVGHAAGRYRTLFPYKPNPMPNFFLAYFNVKNPKFGPFFKGLRSRKEKITTTPSFFGQKLKRGVILYKKN